MRLAILGPGGIAARHAAAARSLGHELVACVGRDLARTAAFAREHGGEPFTDLDRAITAAAPELLVVTLPPFVRGGEVEHAAARGLHLLIEKPVALDEATADRMVRAVAAAGVAAAVGFMYRHGEAVRAWKEADTGATAMYAGAYHCNALHAAWWREEAKSGGQLLEQVIHQVDLVRHLLGEPDTAYARRANLFHRGVARYTGEDVSAVVFGWDDGRVATLNASNVATPGAWHKEWQVYAERLTGRFADWNEAIFTPTVPGAEPRLVAGTVDPFAAQLADLMRAAETGTPPLCDVRDGAATLRLALAARRSADEGREVRLA